jgi:hypothetical protein
MTIDEFTPLVGRAFTVDCDPEPIDLTLVEASAGRHILTEFRPPFTLIFRSQPGILLADGIYTMHCGQWGPGEIFITPVMAAAGNEPGQHYQAVFN